MALTNQSIPEHNSSPVAGFLNELTGLQQVKKSKFLHCEPKQSLWLSVAAVQGTQGLPMKGLAWTKSFMKNSWSQMKYLLIKIEVS